MLPYDCGALADAEIEREIARDLQLGSDDRLTEALADTDGGPAGDRRIVVIFDSLNEFPGDAKTGAETLFRRINALVGRLDSDRVRIVISCSTSELDAHEPVRASAARSGTLLSSRTRRNHAAHEASPPRSSRACTRCTRNRSGCSRRLTGSAPSCANAFAIPFSSA